MPVGAPACSTGWFLESSSCVMGVFSSVSAAFVRVVVVGETGDFFIRSYSLLPAFWRSELWFLSLRLLLERRRVLILLGTRLLGTLSDFLEGDLSRSDSSGAAGIDSSDSFEIAALPFVFDAWASSVLDPADALLLGLLSVPIAVE